MDMIGYVYDDGGREQAGYRGSARDCVARALAIASGCEYQTAYDAVSIANQRYDRIGRKSARNGIDKRARDRVFNEAGFTRVRLGRGPRLTYTEAYERYGDCIVSTTRHVCAIIDGSLRDTFDGRAYYWEEPDGSEVWRERKAMSIWIKA